MNARRHVRARCRCAGSVLACALFVLRSGAAHADEPAPTGDAAAAPDSGRAAAELFREAEARYTAGDVAGALESMQRSYELSGRPELLYNLGELQRELLHCSAAANAYDEYLARTTRGRHREDAERARAELRAECPDDAVPVTMPVLAPPPAAAIEPAPAPAPPASYWTPTRVAGWSSVGAALAASTGALYFALRGQFDVGKFEGRLGAGRYTPEDQALYARGTRENTWAWALGGGALGLAATGLTLLVVSPQARKPAAARLTVRIGTTASVQAFF